MPLTKENGYDKLMELANSERVIPPGLLKAIAAVETEFDSHFHSSNGKRGLMGLQPSVARQHLAGLGYDHVTDNDLYDAEVSIRVAANILRYLFFIGAEQNWSMREVVREYGRVNYSGAEYVAKVMRKFFDYSQRPNQPNEIRPDEVPGYENRML